MAAYQGMPYIRGQIDSILPQLAEDDEIVVSDNGSTDGTAEYLSEAASADPRIRIFDFRAKKGVLANFENALRQCRGEIIFLCDQDDIWLPGRMDRVTSLFREDPGLMAVQVDADLVDGTGNRTAPSFFGIRNSGPGIWKNFSRNTWQGCNMAFRRPLLDLALPFPGSLPMHDMWLGLLAEMTGRVLFLPEVMAHYRRHGENASGMERAAWHRVILWRLGLGAAILSRLPRACRLRKLSKNREF